MNLTFTLNGKAFSDLTSGSFRCKSFSGDGEHRNQWLHQCLKKKGPIPRGRYYIVDRPTGGRLGPIIDAVTRKGEWFALFADDGRIDDYTFCSAVERGNFRLHPKGARGVSEGCIAVEKPNEYATLRNHLLCSMKIDVPGNTKIQAYGILTVK